MFREGLGYVCGTEVMAHLGLWEVIYTTGIMLVDCLAVDEELEVRCLSVGTTLDLEADVGPDEVSDLFYF